jgi:hypothetical protein
MTTLKQLNTMDTKLHERQVCGSGNGNMGPGNSFPIPAWWIRGAGFILSATERL